MSANTEYNKAIAAIATASSLTITGKQYAHPGKWTVFAKGAPLAVNLNEVLPIYTNEQITLQDAETAVDHRFWQFVAQQCHKEIRVHMRLGDDPAGELLATYGPEGQIFVKNLVRDLISYESTPAQVWPRLLRVLNPFAS